MNALAIDQNALPVQRQLPVGPLRVALIGCGKMGMQHLRAISGVPDALVVAVADPAASREDLADLLPSEARLFSDAHVMLKEIRPDVTHIVTPPHSHAALATAALNAGSHVYVEKPFTPTEAEARAIIALANSRGLSVCAGHQCLIEEASVGALRHMSEIGRIVHIESVLSFRTVRRNITPADQAKDILPHAVYPLAEQLRAATGSTAPIEVRAVQAQSEGNLYALLRLGSCTGVLTLTLNGRPVEQYQHLVGTNGSLRADYIIGRAIRLVGPGTGPGILFTPYRRALSTLWCATSGFISLIFGRGGSYRGLGMLIGAFYASIRTGMPPPLRPMSIVDTVSVCERLGAALDEAERESELFAREMLAAGEAELPPLKTVGRVLVTGGTGFLGRQVAKELRGTGNPVRVLTRRVPRAADRVAGVDYVTGDLSQPLAPEVMEGIGVVVHCAAETAGGQRDHERNSVAATRHVVEAAANAGVTRVVNVSSIAVLKRGRGPFDERTPADFGNLERGPYVWGKAEAERVAHEVGKATGVRVKTIRPGPLVDYSDFSPPGRLGREIGPIFVAIGGRRSLLSVCDVGTASRVIRSYVEDFDAAPDLVNLVEAPPPTRQELAGRLREKRQDLRFVWIPALLLRVLSGPAKLMQRWILGSKKPIDVYAAFASEDYRTDVAEAVIARANGN